MLRNNFRAYKVLKLTAFSRDYTNIVNGDVALVFKRDSLSGSFEHDL